MDVLGHERVTKSQRTLASAALATIAALAAGGCASPPRCDRTDRPDPWYASLGITWTEDAASRRFITIENSSYLIPIGRDEVEIVVRVNGTEVWRRTVRRERYINMPEVEAMDVPTDLERAAEFTYVIEAGGARYSLVGPDPLCRWVEIHCRSSGGGGWAPASCFGA